MTTDWVVPHTDSGQVAIEPGRGGWRYTGLLVQNLTEDKPLQVQTGDCEYLVLALAAGDLVVDCDGHTERLAGRSNVFAGPADVAYIPRNTTLTVTGTGRVALPYAIATADLPMSVVRAGQVPVELRGAGSCSRQVHNFGTPGVLQASAIIACEVITPAGNWSSYPPHKHDEYRPGEESQLEEIYYFEVRADSGAPPSADPVGYQCVYGSSERPIRVQTEVRSGDVVLVPHGWHGPAMAAPGYDLYYLNVMAGPGPERIWLICDDPAHAWVRSTWDTQQIDPRLPLGP